MLVVPVPAMARAMAAIASSVGVALSSTPPAPFTWASI